MQRYREFQPTGFDRKGAFLPDQQDWIVAPVSQNRDSDTLSRSNFEVALRMLGGESDTVEVRRFGHWGPGWFEIIICAPEVHDQTLEEIESALADYPVLDDEDYSTKEWDAAAEYWSNCSIRERVEICQRFRANVFAARRDEIPEQVEISYLADGC